MILIPAMVMSLALSPAAFAMDHKDGGEQCGCQKARMWDKKLDLTDEQKAKIKDIKKQSKEQMQQQYEKLKSVSSQLQQLVTSDKWSEEKLNELIAQKAQIMADKMKIKYNMKHQIYSLLNEKQKQTYSNMMKKWDKKMDKYEKKEMDSDD